jgi:hypothetical protein
LRNAAEGSVVTPEMDPDEVWRLIWIWYNTKQYNSTRYFAYLLCGCMIL